MGILLILYLALQFFSLLESPFHVWEMGDFWDYLNVAPLTFSVHQDYRSRKEHEIINQKTGGPAEGSITMIGQILKICEFGLFGEAFLRKRCIAANGDALDLW